MSKQTCHYLGTIDEQNNPGTPIDYPSFENRCLVESAPSESSLLLADQATYCLSGGYSYCPRYQLIQVSNHRSSGVGLASSGQIDIAYNDHLDVASSDFHSDSPPSFSASLQASIPLESDILNQRIDPDVDDYFFSKFDNFLDGNRESQNRRTKAVWLLSSATFAVVFLCGIVLALVAGWRLVQSNLLTALAESEQLESGQLNEGNGDRVENPTRSAIIIVVTATSEVTGSQSQGDTIGNNVSNVGAARENGLNRRGSLNQQSVSEQSQNTNQSTLRTDFPVAVTPTPIVLELDHQNENAQVGNVQNGGAQEGVLVRNDQQPQSAAPVVNPTETPVPIINVQVPLPQPPIRRPTPEFVIPSSTPVEVGPTETPVPTATWPPPLVLFGAAEEELKEGKCTKVTWTVEHVRAVYYENQAVKGNGEWEECIEDDDETYALTVVLPDGSTDIYTTTVKLKLPTPTPSPTYTFTPEPIPTETWTPLPPTATPTPNYTLGVLLKSVDDVTNYSCAKGQECDIGLLVSNVGNVVDTLAVHMVESGTWPLQLCRQDGVCVQDRLILTNVGEGNTAFITLKLDVSEGSEAQVSQYRLRASSQLSGGAVNSETLAIQVEVKE